MKVIGALFEIESIVFTGPIFGIGGLLISAICYRRNIAQGFLFGLFVPTIAVVCFGLIFGLRWSPREAHIPIGLVVCASAVIAMPLAALAIVEAGRADLPVRPIKIQFGISVLMGLMLVVAIPLGLLRSGQQIGAAAGILVSYLLVAAFVMKRFYGGRADTL